MNRGPHDDGPVDEHGPGRGVGEQDPHHVAHLAERGQQRRGQGVGRQDVEGGAQDVGGRGRERVEQLQQRRMDLVTSAVRPQPRVQAGEPEQVFPAVGAQAQGLADGGQDLRRGVALAALFEAGVVVGADAGQDRHLFPPQPRHPAAPARGGEPRVGGIKPGAVRAEEFAEGTGRGCGHTRDGSHGHRHGAVHARWNSFEDRPLMVVLPCW